MDTLSYKSQSANKGTVDKKWFLVDAQDQVVGRLASHIAHYLKGKHKPSYTPHVDCGDNIIVLNAEKVRFTGSKMQDKEYTRYSGYPGGQKVSTPERLMEYKPTAVLEKAVKGMLPKNKLGSKMFGNLYVYEGDSHPHAAQSPKELKIN